MKIANPERYAWVVDIEQANPDGSLKDGWLDHIKPVEPAQLGYAMGTGLYRSLTQDQENLARLHAAGAEPEPPAPVTPAAPTPTPDGGVKVTTNAAATATKGGRKAKANAQADPEVPPVVDPVIPEGGGEVPPVVDGDQAPQGDVPPADPEVTE